MRHARLDTFCYTLGLCLVGGLVPSPLIAADQSWTPIVVNVSKSRISHPQHLALPVPHPKRAAIKKLADAADRGRPLDPIDSEETTSGPVPAAADIVTGTIGTAAPTRPLSASDSARLFEASPGAPARAGKRVPQQRAPKEKPAVEAPPAVTVPTSDLAQGYCVSVGDAAADARIAWQRAKLAELEQQLGERIAVLEAKTAEFKAWLQRRDEFSRKATDTLVQIYARMEPDVAALQFVAMDEETAAAVLTKLNPRNASSIMNEMQPQKAARITGTIAGVARVPKEDKRAAPAVAERARGASARRNRGGPRQ